MRQLPENVVAYKTLGPFAWGQIPSPLFRRHNTKKDVWGTLKVISGQVTYKLEDVEETFELSTGETQVIRPQEAHRLVIPDGSDETELIILVTFYKVPKQG